MTKFRFNNFIPLHFVLAISAGIICAGIALSNAGVEMYDLPVGCTLVSIND